jgi:hypothetical protein
MPLGMDGDDKDIQGVHFGQPSHIKSNINTGEFAASTIATTTTTTATEATSTTTNITTTTTITTADTPRPLCSASPQRSTASALTHGTALAGLYHCLIAADIRFLRFVFVDTSNQIRVKVILTLHLLCSLSLHSYDA